MSRDKICLIWGQSNGVGTARVSDMSEADAVYAADFDMPYLCRIGTDGDPPTVNTYDWGVVGPRTSTSGLLVYGIELTLARWLEAREPGRWIIVKDARSSTSLGGEWDPYGNYPASTSPPNLFNDVIARTVAAETAMSAQVRAGIWIQGEADAAGEAGATAYGANLSEFSTLFRDQFPDATFYYNRLHANASLASCPYRDTVRAQQESLQNATGMRMLSSDPFQLAGDGIHYTGQGYFDMGNAFGALISRRGVPATNNFVSGFLS